MRKTLKQFSLLIVLSICVGDLFGQKVFIANDFGNCGVGLRDSSGKWLADPIYTRIRTTGVKNYFNMTLGSKEGIMDSTGKIIIPAIYDDVYVKEVSVDSNSFPLFVLTLENKMGVMNLSNQFIVPLNVLDVTVYADGSIIAKTSRKHYSIVDTKGKATPILQKLPEEPISLGDHLYKVSKNTFAIEINRIRYYHHRHHRLFKRHKIEIKHKYGVKNDSLQLIIPKHFSDIYYGPDQFNLISVTKHGKTGFYSIAGKEIWKPQFTEESRFTYGYKAGRNGSYAIPINVLGYMVVQKGKKYGIIGVSGDTLLPFIYDNMYSLSSNYEINRNGNYQVRLNKQSGIYSPSTRKWIIPVEYSRLEFVKSYSYASDTNFQIILEEDIESGFSFRNNQSGLCIYVAQKGGYYGMISTNGQEILPFKYDHYENSMGSYYFFQGENTDIVTFPNIKDTANTLRSTQIYFPIVSVAPKSEHFQKIEKENGITIFINPDLINDPKQRKYYNYQKGPIAILPETYDSLIHATAIIISHPVPTKPMAGLKTLYKDVNLNLNGDTTYRAELYTISTKGYYKIRTLNYFESDSFHIYYKFRFGNGVFRDDGFTVVPDHSRHSVYKMGTTNGLAYFHISGTKKNSTGIIDGNGKILVDTIYNSVKASRGNLVWVVKREPRLFENKWYYWNILDTTTHQLLLTKNQYSGSEGYFGKETAIIDRPNGPLLYNTTTKSYVKTGPINDCFKLDSAGRFFAIRTCFGHIGIIDANGKWLADTIWNTLIHADNVQSGVENYYWRGSDFRNTSIYNYCVLSNDTGWMIFDGPNGKMVHDRQTADFLLKKSKDSFVETPRSQIRKFCVDCPSYQLLEDSTMPKNILVWQEVLLFDSLFTGEQFIADSTHNWFAPTCRTCYKVNGKQSFQYSWSKNYDRETLHHTIEFANDSCLSVSRSNFSFFTLSNNPPKDLFFTAMLYKDCPHPMLLDSLFAGTAWKTFISDEVTNYFESHPHIEGNCHNPYMLPFVMKDRFVITSDGILLFPPNYKEKNEQLSVPISWEKLKPYLRKDVALKLNIH